MFITLHCLFDAPLLAVACLRKIVRFRLSAWEAVLVANVILEPATEKTLDQ